MLGVRWVWSKEQPDLVFLYEKAATNFHAKAIFFRKSLKKATPKIGAASRSKTSNRSICPGLHRDRFGQGLFGFEFLASRSQALHGNALWRGCAWLRAEHVGDARPLYS